MSLLHKVHEAAPASWHAYVERSICGWTRHRDIVARFGRFPHRNEILGRTNTAEEVAFLATDGEALQEIYAEIDEMERANIGRIEYRNYDEKYHFFLIPALALAFLCVLMGETVLRRIP